MVIKYCVSMSKSEITSQSLSQLHLFEVQESVSHIMAAKKKTAESSESGSNKSALIRDYQTSNPTAKPREIAAALAEQGVTVSAQQVSTVLSNARKAGKIGKGAGVGKRGRKRGTKVAATTTASTKTSSATLESAVDFARSVGGIEKARAALDTLQAIKDRL